MKKYSVKIRQEKEIPIINELIDRIKARLVEEDFLLIAKHMGVI